jgi:hypothetical protein
LEDADSERVARGQSRAASEVEFEAAVRELGAAGIDRARISFLAQEEIAASRAGAVGCDIKQLPRVEMGLSDTGGRFARLRPRSRPLSRRSPAPVPNAVTTGKFVCDGNEIMGISTQAPIYAELEGKCAGGAVSFNGRELAIEEVA